MGETGKFDIRTPKPRPMWPILGRIGSKLPKMGPVKLARFFGEIGAEFSEAAEATPSLKTRNWGRAAIYNAV